MLHPQARGLLDFMVARGVPATHTLPAAEARAFYRERRAVTQPEPSAVAEVRELSAPGPGGAIPLRLYRPMGSQGTDLLPVLVYYHGGGWVIGDLESHDGACRRLATALDAVVVATDYRRAPEHKFPAAADDCYAALEWAAEHAAELKIDETRLAVAGDSAGGNLAAAVALMARDRNGPPLCTSSSCIP